MHGVKCLHHGLLRGEQLAGGWQRSVRQWPGHALAADRALLGRWRGVHAGIAGEGRTVPAPDVPAMRGGALRDRLPGGRKVRYFNWFNHPETSWPKPLELQLTPDVTVRSKGIMEKCTFYVQGLTEAKSTARTEKRTVRDGEVLTACAQACRTSAIHFGNLGDGSSEVARMWKAQARGVIRRPTEQGRSARDGGATGQRG